MRIFVLISTLADGLCRVPSMLLPPEPGVQYVVVWQHGDTPADTRPEEVLQTLGARADVHLTEMEGIGLSRSRNRAIELALGLRDDALEDAVLLIADDDEHLDAEAFDRIRNVYGQSERLDAALFRVRSNVDGSYFKRYPEHTTAYADRPRSYYPCSWELTLRCRVCLAGIRFDERFGLGAERLCAGEEDVLLTDLTRRGFQVNIVPFDIGTTDPVTTGSHVLDPKVLRSKGAVYGYQHPMWRALLRSLRESASLAVRHRVSMMHVFRNIWYGVRLVN